MKMGLRSLLFGAHAFYLHPISVWIAWVKLFGLRPALDIRIIIACIVHDWGYWNKSEMDSPDGKMHPELGGRIMGYLFGYPWDQFTARHSLGYCRLYHI